MVAIVKRQINLAAEHKYLDVYAQTYPFYYGTASVGKLLNGMVQGLTPITRVGRVITCKSIRIKGDVNRLTNAGFNAQYLCIALIWDKEPDHPATVPTWGDVFSYMNNASDAKSFPNISNAGRFKVLRKKYLEIAPQFSIGGINPAQNDGIQAKPDSFRVNWNVRLNKKTLYTSTGNAGTIADINKGALFLITSAMVQDSGAADTHQFAYSARLSFTDQ